MASVYQLLEPEAAQFLGSAFPQFDKVNGSAFPASKLMFDAAADEAAFWRLDAAKYGSGNLTVDIYWYAENATSGDVVWGAALAAITPDSDNQNVETKALGSEVTVTDSHLGSTSKRLHKATITLSQLDSIAALDAAWLRIRRVGSNGSDNMANDAALERVAVSYSDT